MDARHPVTGSRAGNVANWVIIAQRVHGGENVPVGGRPLEEQIALAAENVRRLVAMAAAHRPDNPYLAKHGVAVESSAEFCVAVALSADEIEARAARRRDALADSRDGIVRCAPDAA
jgi:hypothetical protein